MHRKPDSELVLLDLENERTLKKLRKLKITQGVEMAAKQNDHNETYCALAYSWGLLEAYSY